MVRTSPQVLIRSGGPVVVRVVKFLSGGVQNWNDFCLKNNILKGNYWILRIGAIGRYQKLGIILENEVIQKLMLYIKKCAPTWIFHIKKMRRISMIFDLEN